MYLRNVSKHMCVAVLTTGLLSACENNDNHSVDPNPQIRGLSNQSIAQDTSTAAIGFTVSDADSGADNLTVTAISSDTALVPDEGITLAGSGANRTIQLTPATEAYGETTITIRAVDPTNRSSMSTFKLLVNGVFVPVSTSTFTAFAVEESGEPKTVNGMTFTGDVDNDPTAFDSLL